MTPLAALLAIIAVFVIGMAFIALSEGLAFLAPKSTTGLNRSAAHFCHDCCRTSDGRCPLSNSEDQALNCPLWKFIDADLPTVTYGSPFPATST
jgi:hypothetical protein